MNDFQHTVCRLIVSSLLMLTASSGAWAETPSPGSTLDALVAGEYLYSDLAEQVEPLGADEMASTRGELWPLVGAIGAVVSVDLALQAYFWGVYVPAMSSSPTECVTCRVPVMRQY